MDKGGIEQRVVPRTDDVATDRARDRVQDDALSVLEDVVRQRPELSAGDECSETTAQERVILDLGFDAGQHPFLPPARDSSLAFECDPGHPRLELL